MERRRVYDPRRRGATTSSSSSESQQRSFKSFRLLQLYNFYARRPPGGDDSWSVVDDSESQQYSASASSVASADGDTVRSTSTRSSSSPSPLHSDTDSNDDDALPPLAVEVEAPRRSDAFASDAARDALRAAASRERRRLRFGSASTGDTHVAYRFHDRRGDGRYRYCEKCTHDLIFTAGNPMFNESSINYDTTI